MIYEIAGISDSINQGDILSQCPLIYWLMERRSDGMMERRATVSHERVVVLTQSCDLANDKTTNVQVAVAHEARRLSNWDCSRSIPYAIKSGGIASLVGIFCRPDRTSPNPLWISAIFTRCLVHCCSNKFRRPVAR
jgi:hypothetical protein